MLEFLLINNLRATLMFNPIIGKKLNQILFCCFIHFFLRALNTQKRINEFVWKKTESWFSKNVEKISRTENIENKWKLSK